MAPKNSKGKGKQVETSKSKKGRASSSSTTQEIPPIVVTPTFFSYDEQQAFDALFNVAVFPTRFVRVGLAQKMGLHGDVTELLQRMGLGFFANKRLPTYPGLARDFLASVEVKYKNPARKTASEAMLHFKVANFEYRIAMFEVCDAFGFPRANMVKFPILRRANEFWDAIAYGGYAPNTAKASRIRSPVLRYTHKLLANTIFARKDTSAVKRGELHLLFQGLKHIIRDSNGDLFNDPIGDDINLGCILTHEMEKIKGWAQRTTEPQLFIGSMITPILDKVGVNLEDHFCDTVFNHLDYDYLVKCKFLKDLEDTTAYHYTYTTRDKVRRILKLPNVEKTSLAQLDNVIFDHEGEVDESQEQALEEEEDIDQPEQPQPEQPLPEQQLPEEITIKPKTKREKIFYNAYKAQKKFNKWTMKMFEKLKRKIKRMPGYVSSEEEEEEFDLEANEDNEHEDKGKEEDDEQAGKDAASDWIEDEDDVNLQQFLEKRNKRPRSGHDGASSSHHP